MNTRLAPSREPEAKCVNSSSTPPTRRARPRAPLAPTKWKRGATSTEMMVVTGFVALGALAGFRNLGAANSRTIGCLGGKIFGTGADCGAGSAAAAGDALPPPPGATEAAQGSGSLGTPSREAAVAGAAEEEPSVGAAQRPPSKKAGGVPLHDLTYRISDDINNDPKFDGKNGHPKWQDMVTPDHPGRTMDVAGNSTMSWVYGETQAVGVCRNLAGKVGVSEKELFSGGTCLQIGSYPKKFRVEDQLEDGQGCNDASKQHVDFHKAAYDDVQKYRKDHPKDTDIKRVDCGSAPKDITVSFRDYDKSSDKHKAVRFDNANAPVTGATLVTRDGRRLKGELQTNGTWLFQDWNGADLVGMQSFELTMKGANGKPTTDTIKVDTPKASDVHGTAVRGNDVKRAGTINTYEARQDDDAGEALARANKRKKCITYLTDHPDATRAQAKVNGGCE